MKRFLAIVPAVLALAACGSPGGPARNASQPLVYLRSARSASSISACLESRLARVRATIVGNETELAVGSDSDTAYFVTLTPLADGAVVKVMRPAHASDDPPEPELRFDIARCTT
jgi:hypothetical protein